MLSSTTPLFLLSVGYTTNDVIYRWNKNRQAVAIADDMKLSQFDLVDCPAGNSTDTVLKTPSIQMGNQTPSHTPCKYNSELIKVHVDVHKCEMDSGSILCSSEI